MKILFCFLWLGASICIAGEDVYYFLTTSEIHENLEVEEWSLARYSPNQDSVLIKTLISTTGDILEKLDGSEDKLLGIIKEDNTLAPEQKEEIVNLLKIEEARIVIAGWE